MRSKDLEESSKLYVVHVPLIFNHYHPISDDKKLGGGDRYALVYGHWYTTVLCGSLRHRNPISDWHWSLLAHGAVESGCSCNLELRTDRADGCGHLHGMFDQAGAGATRTPPMGMTGYSAKGDETRVELSGRGRCTFPM